VRGPGVAVAALALAGCGRISFEARADGSSSGDGSADSGGTPIVQRFDVTLATSPTVVSIMPVDPSRTMVLCDANMTQSAAGYQPTCVLTDGQRVTVSAGFPDPNTHVLLQVVQLPVGSVVQRGTYKFGSAESMVVLPITSVDLTSSFPILTRTLNFATVGLDERFNISALITAPNELTLRRSSTGNSVDTAWQVVSIPGAVVTTQTMTLTSDLTLDFPNAIDVSHTFLIGTRSGGSGDEGDYLARLSFSAVGDRFRILRNTAGSNLLVSYAAVELPGASALHGELALSTESLVTSALQRTVDPTRSFVIPSVQGGRAATNDDFAASSVAISVQADMVTLQRGVPTNVNGTVSWDVVELPQ
jgi:hypothetical protein